MRLEKLFKAFVEAVTKHMGPGRYLKFSMIINPILLEHDEYWF